MKSGKDFIGLGCGAVVRNSEGKILLMQRGPKSKNEPGTWTIPGGSVEFGETMADAIARETKEELGIEVKVLGQYGCADHIMPKEGQHWVSIIFKCEIVSGEPKILEPEKCSGVGWFALERIWELPLGVIMKENLKLIK